MAEGAPVDGSQVLEGIAGGAVVGASGTEAKGLGTPALSGVDGRGNTPNVDGNAGPGPGASAVANAAGTANGDRGGGVGAFGSGVVVALAGAVAGAGVGVCGSGPRVGAFGTVVAGVFAATSIAGVGGVAAGGLIAVDVGSWCGENEKLAGTFRPDGIRGTTSENPCAGVAARGITIGLPDGPVTIETPDAANAWGLTWSRRIAVEVSSARTRLRLARSYKRA